MELVAATLVVWWCGGVVLGVLWVSIRSCNSKFAVK